MIPPKIWKVYKRDQRKSLLEHLCQIRKIVPEELAMDFTAHLHNPNLLPQMNKARSVMVEAVKENWPVAIFGDYDADGTPAAALLAGVCQRLGLSYIVYLPTRQTGYGLGESFIEPIAKQAKLLITVDTGITAVESINKLNELGVNTIILDHHLPPEGELPPAEAIIDPYLPNSKYPFPHICGCTLAYKLAVALQEDFPDLLTEGFLKWQLDLVAISTVADMMEMRGENRPLVSYGLQVLKKTRRPGLMALLRQTGIKIDELSAGNLGFTIGPRFNAAGRMGDNRPMLDLLLTTDPVRAEELALQIEQLNRDRQVLVETILDDAQKLIWSQNKHDDFLLVLTNSRRDTSRKAHGKNTARYNDWPSGVVGLVAGKLAEKYYRPTIVGSQKDGVIRASARSVGDYPIIDGLTAASSHLTQFGGHRQAAGLTVQADSWEPLAVSLKQHARQHFDGILPQPALKADDYLTLENATLSQAQELATLEPHGLGNARPTFIIRDIELKDAKPIGETKKHLRLTLTNGLQQLPAIGFSLYDKFKTHQSIRADVAGHLTANTWNGNTSVQFQVTDFREVGGEIGEESIS